MTSKALSRMVTKFGRRPDWSALYADATNAENFRIWLRLVLGSEGEFISKEAYSIGSIHAVVGFMTYRFLSLSTRFDKWTSEGQASTSYDEVVDFANKHTIAKKILRMETLDADLHDLLRSIGKEVDAEDIAALEKTNTSSHRKYDEYYDDETYTLVARRDRFVIDRFGY